MSPGSKILQGIKAWRHSEELAETIRKKNKSEWNASQCGWSKNHFAFPEEMEKKFYLQPFVCGKHMKYMS